jgi:putative hydrolase of HD superfamily
MLPILADLQRLKRLDRTGWVLRGLAPGAESVAAHTFGVALAAMLLADGVRARGVEVNVERTMAKYYGAGARRAAEGAAFGEMIEGLGAEQGAEYAGLHEEYEGRATIEARLVKAADIVDLLAQALAFERAGARELDEFWEGVEGRDFELEGAAREVVAETLGALVAAREELRGR